MRTTTAVYNQYVSTQIAIGTTGTAIGKVYIRKNTQKSGAYTFGDWIKINHEATKKKNTKTQYVVGKAMPIGKLDGGARLNVYLMRFGIFNFKLYNVPQLKNLISSQNKSELDKLLVGVTWHVFINDYEVYTGKGNFISCGVLSIYIKSYRQIVAFYKLDESKSSVDLSSDMYIYLRIASKNNSRQNYTSKTLFYQKGKRIWKPAIESPYMEFKANHSNWLRNSHSGHIQIQRLCTSQNSSLLSGSREKYSVRNYRGNYDDVPINYFGIYRYRLVKNGKKTKWRTISIMNNEGINSSLNRYSIK